MRKIFDLLCLLSIAATSCDASALLKPKGGAAAELNARALEVSATIRGAFAQTTVTTTYVNPNDRDREAEFFYEAPPGVVVTGFAYWNRDEKVTARVVERARAARIYQTITTYRADPALIEMVGKNSFRARIFPVFGGQDLKVEVKLAQALPAVREGALWSYPARELVGNAKDAKLEHFALTVRGAGALKSNMGAFKNGVLSVKKTDYRPDDDARVVVAQNAAPLRASLLAARDGGADGFFAVSLTPRDGLVRPRFKISGVATYDVLTPRVDRVAGGQNYTVYGRYRGAGRAIVSLNSESVSLQLPATRAPDNAAAKLWAARYLERLSENSANRFKVVALSKRFGLVSKWTSWLAIPRAERENFAQITAQADRDNAGRAYAMAYAQRDAKSAAAQKQIFERLTARLNKDGRGRRSRPLAAYLGDALDQVSMAVKVSRADAKVSPQSARLKRIEANLIAAGARHTESYPFQSANALADALIAEQLRNGANSARAVRLRSELKSNFSAFEEAGSDLSEANRSALAQEFIEIAAGKAIKEVASDLGLELVQPAPNAKRVKTLQTRIDEMDDLVYARGARPDGKDHRSSYDGSKYSITKAHRALAHEKAYQVLQEEAKSPANQSKLKQLRAALDREAKASGKSAQEYLGVERYSFEAGYPTLTAQQYYLKRGDPLISVIAPANCQRIIAILPDGSLLPLTYDAKKQTWEARFDVPNYVAQGQYEVTILIVDARGKRQHLTMGYLVDDTAPGGVAAVRRDGHNWKLTLRTDEGSRRVSAFTPWNARIELRRGENGVFAAPLEVPAAWAGRKAVVTFVLTDAAHNRTEISVDWN